MYRLVFFMYVWLLFSNTSIRAEAQREMAPEFSNLQWRNAVSEISETHINDEVCISFRAKNMSAGETVKIEIWEYSDGEMKDLISELEGVVEDEQVNCNYIIQYDEENTGAQYTKEIAEKGYTILDYVFVVSYWYQTVLSRQYIYAKSGELAINDWITRQILDPKTQQPIASKEYAIRTPDQNLITGKTDSEGWIIVKNLRKIGTYRLNL